jgi:hypothetical protein
MWEDQVESRNPTMDAPPSSVKSERLKLPTLGKSSDATDSVELLEEEE